METLPLPIAILDFFSVVLFAIGFFCLARLITRLNRQCGQLATIGFLLITLGGLCKALWKLIFAITELNIRVLDNSFFILLAPGLVCVAWALWNAFRPLGGTPVWVVPVIVIATAEGAAAIRALSKGGRGWLYILLGLAVLVYLLLSLSLIFEVWRRQKRLLAVLFAFSAAAFFLQARLPLLPVYTPFWQWIEQLNIVFGGAALAYAAWSLEHAITGQK